MPNSFFVVVVVVFSVSVVARWWLWVENDLRDLKTRSGAPVSESVQN